MFYILLNYQLNLTAPKSCAIVRVVYNNTAHIHITAVTGLTSGLRNKIDNLKKHQTKQQTKQESSISPNLFSKK